MAVNPSAPCCYNLEEGSMTTRKSITIKNDNNNKTTIFTNIIQPIIVELVKRNNILLSNIYLLYLDRYYLLYFNWIIWCL